MTLRESDSAMHNTVAVEQPQPTPRRRRRWLKLVMAIVVLGCIFWFLAPSPDDDAKPKGKNGAPVPVGAATVKTGDINIYLNGLGTVTPRNVVVLHSRIDGELMQLLFQEGQEVKAGHVLAKIDPRPYQAQLDQATGQMLRDQALLKDAQINLKRYQELFAQDSIAKQQMDTQESLVKQYKGAVQTDQGLVDNAKVQLAYTHITSPINGRVGLRQVDPGNIVHASDANGIVVVTQLQPITVIFSLPEDNIPTVMTQLQEDVPLVVEAWARDDKTKLSTGTLLAVDNQVDTTTGTVKFKAEFPNQDHMLFANQFVNIHMLLDTKKGVVLIPAAGVQRGTQGTFAYVVKDQKTVALQKITLGAAEGEKVAVESGLQPEDIVVIDGTDSLRDGAKIKLATLDGKPQGATENPAKAEGDKKADHPHHKKPAS